MKNKLFYSLLLMGLAQFAMFAQDKKSVDADKEISVDNIVMTWNKSTPESEMKDDIKALAEHGVTITYSGVKRNSEGEITAISVAYSDKNGSKGSMSLDSKNPINTIKVYKQGDEVGFGSPNGSDFMSGDAFAFAPNDMMKGFSFNEGGMPGQSFNFQFPQGNSFGQSSKVIIKKDGKKPLIIEDGNVVEGGDDYTKEELEDIKKNNKVESYGGSGFGWNGDNQNMEEQLEKMQEQIDRMVEKQTFKRKGNSDAQSELDKSREEMLKAKEEMENAKKEMENAKKELEKAKKSSLKTQKS